MKFFLSVGCLSGGLVLGGAACGTSSSPLDTTNDAGATGAGSSGSGGASSSSGSTPSSSGGSSSGAGAGSGSSSGGGAGSGSSSGGSASSSGAGDDGGDAGGSGGGDDADTVGDSFAGTTVSIEVTAYGWEDNSPPGNAIAYPANGGFPTIHNAAGGTGTYADPITFATDKDEYPPGTILYIPFMEKYVIMEDDCTQCDNDWSSSMMGHIDVWMNSNGTESVNALYACEDTWTRSPGQVVTSPAPNLTVTTAPLFDPATNTCRTSP